MAYRTELTEDELDEAAVADAVNTFLLVKSRDWRRREKNRLFPLVFAQIDKARDLGDKPDVRAIVRSVFNDDLRLS